MPPDVAEYLEDACLDVLARAGFRPVHGREHFPLVALPTVLDFLDRHENKLGHYSHSGYLAARLYECPTCHGRGGVRCHGGCHLIECLGCLGQGQQVKDIGPPPTITAGGSDADSLILSLYFSISTIEEIAAAIRAHYPPEFCRRLAEELLDRLPR